MPNPAWFDANFYAAQKVAQMNAIKYQDKTDWDVSSYQDALNSFSPALSGSTVDEKAFTNFQACNQSGYASGITLADINVSPNQYFDVAVYAQNLADYNNQNPDAYDKPAPEGGWTVSNILSEMLSGGYSAWQHYTDSGMALGINPSNLFDTSAYLAARAEAMGNGATAADALKAIQASGMNAIQDFFVNGSSLEIATPPAPATATTPNVPAGWNQWADAAEPAEDDPYANVTQTVTMTAAQTVYPGAGESYTGQNTQFDANLSAQSAKVTLKADDQIDGGDGYNTLAVNDFARNWSGFKGVKVEGQDELADNITNVGRVVLNHTSANTESSYQFDASYISDDTVRFDINNTGNGTIGLTNLSKAVTEVNISGLSAKGADVVGGGTKTGTTLQWEDKALAGDNDVLTLGLNNVGKTGSVANINAEGIEHLTINAKSGSTNVVNLKGFSDLTDIAIKGAGNVTITDVINRGITSYDASEATGTVDMAVGRLANDTVIKGSEGLTTVTLTNASNTLTPESWTSVERITLLGNSMNVDATNIDGLQVLTVNGTSARMSNVTATDFTISQGNASANIQVNGGPNGTLENVTYNAYTSATGKTSTDATGDIIMNVLTTGTGKNQTGADFQANFTANSATGDVVLNVLEGDTTEQNASLSEGTVINATSAQTFTANIDGTLNTGAVFNVVGGEAAAGRTVTINVANIAPADDTTDPVTPAELTLKADGATDLKMSLTGGLKLADGSSMKGAENINIDVTKDESGADVFDASAINFSSAQNVTVDATEMAVTLGNLGSKTSDGPMKIEVTGDEVTIGDMGTGKGWNISANISAGKSVTIGAINAGTLDDDNQEGDVNLVITTGTTDDTTADLASKDTSGSVQDLTITGDTLNIDFSGVAGKIATGQSIMLGAKADIQYIGNAEEEQIVVTNIGTGTSNFETGAGGDKLYIGYTAADAAITKPGMLSMDTNITIDLGAGEDKLFVSGNTVARNQTVTMDVNLGTDTDVDEITVENASMVTGAQLIMNISGFSGDKINGAVAPTDAQAAADILADFGYGTVSTEDITTKDDCFQYDGYTFAVDAATAADAHVLFVIDTLVDSVAGA